MEESVITFIHQLILKWEFRLPSSGCHVSIIFLSFLFGLFSFCSYPVCLLCLRYSSSFRSCPFLFHLITRWPRFASSCVLNCGPKVSPLHYLAVNLIWQVLRRSRLHQQRPLTPPAAGNAKGVQWTGHHDAIIRGCEAGPNLKRFGHTLKLQDVTSNSIYSTWICAAWGVWHGYLTTFDQRFCQGCCLQLPPTPDDIDGVRIWNPWSCLSQLSSEHNRRLQRVRKPKELTRIQRWHVQVCWLR